MDCTNAFEQNIEGALLDDDSGNTLAQEAASLCVTHPGRYDENSSREAQFPGCRQKLRCSFHAEVVIQQDYIDWPFLQGAQGILNSAAIGNLDIRLRTEHPRNAFSKCGMIVH